MIDLHTEDSEINHYADRYRTYMPINVRKAIKNNGIDGLTSSQAWDETLPLITTEDIHVIKHLGRWSVWLLGTQSALLSSLRKETVNM